MTVRMIESETDRASAYRPRGGIHGSDVPTQRLGRQLERTAGIEGFIAYSARVATHKTLMIYPHKRLPGSRIDYWNKAKKKWVKWP